MKIAINTRFLLKDRLEGIGWFTYQVVKRLVERHPEHEFIFFFDRPYEEEFIFAKNVTPVVLFPPARHPVLWYLWFEWAVAKALKTYQADVFFSPDNYLSLRSSVPTVMVVHDIAYVHYPDQVPFIFKKFYQHFVPKYLKRADTIVTVSHYTKEDMIQHFPNTKNKIIVTCNGCKPDFQPLNPETVQRIRAQYASGQAYFFYVGSINPRKNVHRLISAFDRFKQQSQSETKLLIGGRFGWQTGAVKTAYENAQHKEDIVFLGYVSDEALPRLMAAALALTYISLFEGFGVPLLEAMQCGVPVITSNISSMPEVVGEAGLLVNPESVEDIAEKMFCIYKEENLRKDLIEKGKRQAQRFTWDIATDVVEGVLLKRGAFLPKE